MLIAIAAMLFYAGIGLIMEEGLFTEAIIGRSVSDVVNLDSPKNLLAAKEEELSELGLFILGKIVKKIRHIQIDGVSYISFVA